AEITPAEARRIGVGELPMFSRPQPVRVSARVGEGTGSMDYTAGGLTGRLEWSPGPRKGALAYSYRTTLDGDDLKGLGVPFELDRPLEVSARGIGYDGGLTGEGEAAGARLRYEISPEQAGRRRLDFSGSASDATFARFGLD